MLKIIWITILSLCSHLHLRILWHLELWSKLNSTFREKSLENNCCVNLIHVFPLVRERPTWTREFVWKNNSKNYLLSLLSTALNYREFFFYVSWLITKLSFVSAAAMKTGPRPIRAREWNNFVFLCNFLCGLHNCIRNHPQLPEFKQRPLFSSLSFDLMGV